MHLDYVKKANIFPMKCCPKVPDQQLVAPKLFRSQQGTVQHCHYLMVMLEHPGLKITDFDHIDDIGGGYGNLVEWQGCWDIEEILILWIFQ